MWSLRFALLPASINIDVDYTRRSHGRILSSRFRLFAIRYKEIVLFFGNVVGMLVVLCG